MHFEPSTVSCTHQYYDVCQIQGEKIKTSKTEQSHQLSGGSTDVAAMADVGTFGMPCDKAICTAGLVGPTSPGLRLCEASCCEEINYVQVVCTAQPMPARKGARWQGTFTALMMSLCCTWSSSSRGQSTTSLPKRM